MDGGNRKNKLEKKRNLHLQIFASNPADYVIRTSCLEQLTSATSIEDFGSFSMVKFSLIYTLISVLFSFTSVQLREAGSALKSIESSEAIKYNEALGANQSLSARYSSRSKHFFNSSKAKKRPKSKKGKEHFKEEIEE